MEIPNRVLPNTAGTQCYEILMSDESPSITLVMTSTQSTAVCPLCQQTSAKVHSQYCRTLADLPWANFPVHIQLNTRRFFCRNPACTRAIFTERLPELVAPWARRTKRLAALQQQIALTAGGVSGAKLCYQLGIQAGIDVLLCSIRQVSPAESFAPRVIGVDDWAQRKGQSYGTIIVDHETGQVIDLLPDRTSETLATWLRHHPSVEVVSRDRAEAYAQGIREGAPDAIQVADRWHLLKNLTDTMFKELQHHHMTIKRCFQEPPVPVSQAAANAETSVLQGQNATDPETPLVGTPNDQRRQARVESAHELRQQGWTQQAIADQLNVHPKTVSRDLKRSWPLPPKGVPRFNLLAPFTGYLVTRWQAGCRNATQLFREIQPKGYSGRITIVRDYIRQLKRAGGNLAVADEPASAAVVDNPTLRPPTLHSLAWLITQPPEALTENEAKSLMRIHSIVPRLDDTVALVQEFARLVRQQQVEGLDAWLERGTDSESSSLRSFARGLRQDYDAVRAALSLPWSNGRVEGQVNRLKCLKRQMYGRAKLDLLQRRLVAT
jgi:transposase